jgi:hypothetical protein
MRANSAAGVDGVGGGLVSHDASTVTSSIVTTAGHNRAGRIRMTNIERRGWKTSKPATLSRRLALRMDSVAN